MLKDSQTYFFDLVFDYFSKEDNKCNQPIHKEAEDGYVYTSLCDASPAVKYGYSCYCKEHLEEGSITREDFVLDKLSELESKNSCLTDKVRSLENSISSIKNYLLRE